MTSSRPPRPILGAGAEWKQRLENRRAEVEVDDKERAAKLKQAGELGKEARKLTRKALTP